MYHFRTTDPFEYRESLPVVDLNLVYTIQNRLAAEGGPKNWVLPVKRQKSSHSQTFGVRSPPWGGGVSSEFLYLSIVLEKCVYLSPM